MTRDFRGIIFNVVFCTFGQYIKALNLEEADAEATLPNWSQNFYATLFFLVRRSHLPHTVWLLQSRMVLQACSPGSHLLVFHFAFCAELMGFANAVLTLTC